MPGFLTPDARLRIVTDLGVVAPGALLHTYVAGTPSTPLASYNNVDCAAGHENANPVVASAGGLFGAIYLTKGVAYKLVLTDADGGAIWSQDDVSVPLDTTLAAGTGISLATVAGVTTISGTVSASIGANDFRLTLESGVPVSSTDQTAKATLYLTPYKGNRIDLYDAAGVPTTIVSAQVSIAVPATTSQLYDVFAYSNAGVVTLELLAWTNDTTRATPLVLTTTGTYTKSGDLTRRYLGSARTTTVSGQMEDSAAKRYIWNYYHRVRRPLLRQETTATWAYTIATIRQANAAAANQVDVVVGVAEALLTLDLHAFVQDGSANKAVAVGIGEDSTTTFSASQTGGAGLTSADGTVSGMGLHATLTKLPAVGRHVYSWNEWSAAAGTSTWYGAPGAASGPANSANGISGALDG